jgi:hypothetical protein
MSLTSYAFPATTVDCDRLTQEIRDSAILTALDHIDVLGPDVTIWFKDALSETDESILDALVAAHIPTPLPENAIQNVTITSQPAVTVAAAPPFGSKTITVGGVTKNLYARFTGLRPTLSIGTNVINYTATYAWAKLIGIEVVNANPLDYADFEVYDTAAGTYSGVPNLKLNQFSFTLNIAPGFYQKIAQFDADLYVGMIIKITYHSVAINTVGINLLLNEVKS